MGILKRAITFLDPFANHFQKNTAFQTIVNEIKETQPACFYFDAEHYLERGGTVIRSVCLVHKVDGFLWDYHGRATSDGNIKEFKFVDMGYEPIYQSGDQHVTAFSNAFLSELPNYKAGSWTLSYRAESSTNVYFFVRDDLELYWNQDQKTAEQRKRTPLKKW